jgi:truncated hemoglobin YjbI
VPRKHRHGAVTGAAEHVHLHAAGRTRGLYGRECKAHARAREQGLNDGHFDKFLRHFRDALMEAGVETDKADKVLKLLEGRRSEVLNP